MISHKHKCIFVHIAKTGGTSIEHVLDPNVKIDQNLNVKSTGNTKFIGKHWKIVDYKKKRNKDIFDSYFKFTFVRNPWESEVSLWKWFQLAKGETISFEKHINRRKKRMGFTEWMCDKNGNNLIDFIGRFENLQKDFNIVCDKIGIPQRKLPHKNKSNHKHYTEYYNDETRSIVAEKYAKDIKRFGYRFE